MIICAPGEMMVKSANKMLGCITNWIENIVIPSYKSVICPCLVYCIQFWSDYLRNRYNSNRRGQRQATKMITGIEKLPYKETLKRLGLFSKEMNKREHDSGIQNNEWDQEGKSGTSIYLVSQYKSKGLFKLKGSSFKLIKGNTLLPNA